MQIAVVTDSSACLPTQLADDAGVHVIPLPVLITGQPARPTGDELIAALRSRTVTTSRPSPDLLAQRYAALLDDGASTVVSVHISAELSGTVDAARIAAQSFGDAVVVVDSRTVAMGLGFAALDAAQTARDGGDVAAVLSRIRETVSRSHVLFYVDTLKYLRRGGRISVPAALVGGALAVRPILRITAGALTVSEKVRTTARAQTRLIQLATTLATASQTPARPTTPADGSPTRGAETSRSDPKGTANGEAPNTGTKSGGTSPYRVAIAHLGAPDVAQRVADELSQRINCASPPIINELDPVLAAHTGPKALGICLSA